MLSTSMATKKSAVKKKQPVAKKQSSKASKKSAADAEMKRLLKAADRIENDLLDVEPDDPELDGMLEDLEQVFRAILQMEPENVPTLIRLGEFFLERGGAEDVALEFLEQALKLQPANKELAKTIKKARARLKRNK
ncbi:hypothetical protein [Pyxidicoccus xibeiensis]|uniref:hypothetical protein n=1 Tax=Pyxidicoccus xibeiensis TaxID=2906759 RepID=UPI0020A726B7|nr:hypothetical protein [Pyxidicoccus xibeiensis]MCP3140880.1 hypothetical protein [Pyxidicoccus xibeiensis]